MKLSLDEGERLILETFAYRRHHLILFDVGQLVVTNRRLVFTPNRLLNGLDPLFWLLGRTRTSITLDTLIEVTTYSWFAGWMFGVLCQPFLRLRTTNGDSHVFQSLYAAYAAKAIRRAMHSSARR